MNAVDNAPSTFVAFIYSVAPAMTDLGGGCFGYVGAGPPLFLTGAGTDGSGVATLPISVPLDPGLEQAAASLGAGRVRVFFEVTLPLALRGCIAGALLCFARSLGEFGATITFAGNVAGETRTLPLAIWSALQRTGGEDSAWRLTWVCVALAVLATLACEWLLRRGRNGGRHA